MPGAARELEPALARNVRLALKFPADGQVENRRLVAALAASLEAHGVSIRTGTEVSALRVKRGRISSVETSDGSSLSAGVVILAAARGSHVS